MLCLLEGTSPRACFATSWAAVARGYHCWIQTVSRHLLSCLCLRLVHLRSTQVVKVQVETNPGWQEQNPSNHALETLEKGETIPAWPLRCLQGQGHQIERPLKSTFLNHRGTWIRVFRACFRAPFLHPPFSLILPLSFPFTPSLLSYPFPLFTSHFPSCLTPRNLWSRHPYNLGTL